MRDFFYHLQGRKPNYKFVTMSQWEQLHSNKFLKKCEIQRIDIHLLFQKTTINQENQKEVGFFGFCKLMGKLYDKVKDKRKCGSDAYDMIDYIWTE